MFYSGSLQEGIAQAVSQAKAVVCFVRDDSETSSKWENDYFTDSEFAQLLESRSVLLRLTKDSAEAGFLTSFCPVTKFPTVIVIKDGTLREYIVPDVEKEGFQGRLRAAIGDAEAQPQAPAQSIAQSSSAASTGTTAPAPVSEPTTAPVPAPMSEPTPVSPTPASTAPRPQNIATQQQPQRKRDEVSAGKKPEKTEPSQSPSTKRQKPQKIDPAPAPQISIKRHDKPAQSSRTMKVEMPTSPPPKTEPEPAPKPQPTPPRQYRLQVRLFDGSSVRSSFTPSQTIRSDVRPWVDSQLEEKRPYNLKHILTPLPNRTLTIAEEEQTLEELGLGSTANLVMVPINTYTEAYSTSGASLPVRAVSSAYGIVSSVVGTATGLVGSLFGYVQPAPPSQAAPSTGSSQTENTNAASAARPRPTGSGGLNIRTLHDQRESRDDSQLYNGNQLNFQPRRDEDGRSLQ
ncbi:hypothetical protein P170DRAFT_434137 [Aspergillus steynii IBT 23096]|uniref:UBX domain-containing protein 2 n=1 Tax=Aspergillus steynii IBT 23096 TaxID=1392250 RepID=A0A2I2GHL6_9EURO|nr:uncharacterized protein P170DRAFT_434137 [Aspergillus steynii IBT 23096]PLB52370.1 hypothetical protein P170DRAFT_434137 [Aspergillus steynii IBT 23096]